MGRLESELCVRPEETFYNEHNQVPEETKLSNISTSEESRLENQIVPDLNTEMSVSLSHPTFGSPRQDQLTVIQTQANRTSYQEIVHSDDDINVSGCSALTRLVTTLTEWLVILQGVAEDRECDRPNVKCRCIKAAKLHEELSLLGRKLSNAEQMFERVGMVGEDDIQEISRQVHKIALMLRSDVSILIPTSIGRADPMVVEQARWLVQDIESKNCASEAVEGVTSLVVRLLGVETCQVCHQSQGTESVPGAERLEGDIEVDGAQSGGPAGEPVHTPEGDVDMDILNLVAGWCSGYPEPPKQEPKDAISPELRELGRQFLEKSRKRKQTRPVKITSPITNRKSRKLESPCATSTTSTAEDTNILSLLEKKKKGVKKDGLYKFVLWREALKEEKSKHSD